MCVCVIVNLTVYLDVCIYVFKCLENFSVFVCVCMVWNVSGYAVCLSVCKCENVSISVRIYMGKCAPVLEFIICVQTCQCVCV